MYVVSREEAEAVLTRNGLARVAGIAAPGREGPQLREAAGVRADRRVLGCGQAAEFDRRVRARRLAAAPVAVIRARFVHGDIEAALGQFLGGRESGDTGAQDHDRPASFACRRGWDCFVAGLGHDDPARRAANSPGCEGARTAAWT